MVEQPDTVVYDYLDPETLLGIEFIELRTGLLDPDAPDKFMRLAVRNFLLPPPEVKGSGEGTSILPRRASIWEYESSDQRDRCRSTLLDKPNTCEYIVGLDVRDPTGWPGPEHLPTIHHFGERWLAAGNYLPPDFDNPTGEPLSAALAERFAFAAISRGSHTRDRGTRSRA